MEETWKKKLLVAAIDLGTTYSGYAISFLDDYEKDKTKIFTQYWHSGDSRTTKTPTVLLLKPNRSFHSFGYDAESKYAALAEEDDHRDWRYFRRFKMELYSDRNRRGISIESKIKDSQGRDFDALEVFAISIKFMKDEIIKEVTKRFHLKEDDVFYVLTVPAIWSDAAKYFMRKAAKLAGIVEQRLRIALEPECAAVFMQATHIPAVAAATKDDISISPGSCHVVVDLGGGTCDIAAHRVNTSNKFEAILPPDGGPWGGDNINTKFEGFLVSISGAPAFTTFKKDHTEDYLDLIRHIEMKKLAFKNDNDEDYVNVKLPESFRKLHREANSEDMSQSVKEMRINSDIKFFKEKIRIARGIFIRFFAETVAGIIQSVERVLTKIPEDQITLIFVGGFSNSAFLQQEVEKKFHGRPILFPPEAELAIMKGAIIYGRDESIIDTRISRYTYGIDWNVDFQKGVHPESKREETDDGYVCTDIFRTIIKKGQKIKWNVPIDALEAYPKSKYQTEMEFPFYRSEIYDSPSFVTDEGCIHMGTLKVSLGNNPSIDQCVKLIVYGGKTEIKAVAEDNDGAKYSMAFSYVET